MTERIKRPMRPSTRGALNRSLRARARSASALRGTAALALPLLLLAGCGEDGPIEQPRPLYGEEPIEYPIDLYDQGIEGEAVLRVRVTTEGTVDSVEVETSADHPGLDSAAVAALRRTAFRPATQDDEFVRAWVRVPVRFSTRPRPQDAR